MEVDVTTKTISHEDIEVSKIVGTAKANYEIEVADTKATPPCRPGMSVCCVESQRSSINTAL